MSIFAISGILIVLTSCILTIILFRYGSTKLHKIWLCFNISLGIWGFASFKIGSLQDPALGVFWFKLSQIGIIPLPAFLYHSICLLCDIKRKAILNFIYLQSLFFLIINILTNSFIESVSLKLPGLYWANLGLLYHPFICLYLIVVAVSFFELINSYKFSEGIRKAQIGYYLLGMLVGFSGGLTNFLLGYDIKFYPIGNFSIPLYPIIVTYAILRYKLMDITLAVTRTGVFVAVYSLVLGIPFALAFGFQEKLKIIFGETWWMAPLITMTILATVGPFIYLYIQNKAESRIFQEQHRYQSTLRQASIGMGRIKDINRLVNLIVHIVTRTVRLEHSMIYLNDESNEVFSLSALKSRHVRFNPEEHIVHDTEIIKQLKKTKRPVVYDEIKQATEDNGDWKLAKLEAELRTYDASLIVPSFIDEKLLAIIVLGPKLSKQLYTEDDLTVFSILANQAALAIENALFFEDIQKTTEQLFKAEKMATIGTMADGLSHQINNRLHALGFIAGDVLDTIKLKKNIPMSAEVKEVMLDIEHALNRVQENVTQGGEIVRGLLKYTRKGEEGLSNVELDQLISAAVEMTQFKIKPGEIALIREYDANLPTFQANFAQLQEVFFNLIDNAYDASMQRKSELKEQGFKPTIRINAKEDNGKMIIHLEDNGMGIRDDDKDKLFTPFFSTKLSSKKGTGLGLYVIQKLIEENHKGKVHYYSEYKKGTKVHIVLPIEQI